MVLNDHVVHDDAPHPNQAFIPDFTPMQNHAMTHRHVMTDDQGRPLGFGWRLVRDMTHAEILDIAAFADPNVIHIPPQNCVTPNR